MASLARAAQNQSGVSLTSTVSSGRPRSVLQPPSVGTSAGPHFLYYSLFLKKNSRLNPRRTYFQIWTLGLGAVSHGTEVIHLGAMSHGAEIPNVAANTAVTWQSSAPQITAPSPFLYAVPSSSLSPRPILLLLSLRPPPPSAARPSSGLLRRRAASFAGRRAFAGP
jgi:hypothetical protein